MTVYTRFSQDVPVFHGRMLPDKGLIVGYSALIHVFELPVPIPDICVVIRKKHGPFKADGWQYLTPRYQPEETLYAQLVFALKYEGVNLLFFKKLFEKLTESEILSLLSLEPTGISTRKIWFLYEWLMGKELPIPDLEIKNYTWMIDNSIQFGLWAGFNSSRHRIVNNLPGTVNFCPLIRKTEKLNEYLSQNLAEKNQKYLDRISKNIIQRATAFLLLKDSKASFTIEGESPKSKRAARWGQAIGQAGLKDLSHEEFERLQQIIIESPRFTTLGYRKKGGFVGEWDKGTNSPIPDHISARPKDIVDLMDGLIETMHLLLDYREYVVLTAAAVSFGFVFIHPFSDGNGRIHRYLIHHVLAKKGFSQQGIIFPISASILNKIVEYRHVLESYSLPLLDFIEWKETSDHNVEVTNETIDYYRYFDATKQAEFLYECVKDTVENIIPQEIEYLKSYQEFKNFLDNSFEMPDNLVALLVNFLEQNHGTLSNRVKKKEFESLNELEVKEIENEYQRLFRSNSQI